MIGLATYLVLRNSLVASLREIQLRRARQIGQLVADEAQAGNVAQVGSEVEKRYAPGANERFVRVTRSDGFVVYRSEAPRDQTFVPADVPAISSEPAKDSLRQVDLGSGRELLVTSHGVTAPGGVRYWVETGALMDEVQSTLRQWLLLLLIAVPAAALIAILGGSFLVRRALGPVDRIAASAERITSQNLSERLPVARSGDELERLSIALNHMIERLDEAFQYSRRFVADASHELRTPLTVVRGEIESFVRDRDLPLEWRERLGSTLE